MLELEVVAVEPSYAFGGGQCAEPYRMEVRHSESDFDTITQTRDAITDEQLGVRRVCCIRTGIAPGCGARVTSLDGEALAIECPAGTLSPYTACAGRVLNTIISQLPQQPGKVAK